MNAGTPISQYQKATAIPDETLYIAEMGDGSGTKVVTQKTLTEEVGKGLKVGNLEDLQTENKESLVAAINEAAQSGGSGAAVDILDTKEEIEANTEPGKAAGAQAVKEIFGALNDNLNGNILTYNESEDAYYIQHGADTVPKKLGSASPGKPTEETYDSIYISSSAAVYIPTYEAKYFQITSNPADNYISIQGAKSNLDKHLIPSFQNGITSNVLSKNSNGVKLDVTNYDFLILSYGVPSSNTTIRDVTAKWFYE